MAGQTRIVRPIVRINHGARTREAWQPASYGKALRAPKFVNRVKSPNNKTNYPVLHVLQLLTCTLFENNYREVLLRFDCELLEPNRSTEARRAATHDNKIVFHRLARCPKRRIHFHVSLVQNRGRSRHAPRNHW